MPRRRNPFKLTHFKLQWGFQKLFSKQQQNHVVVCHKCSKRAKEWGKMLIHTSKHNNVPIARLDCTYNKKRLTNKNDQTCACMSHFDHTKYLKHTDLCVGARVAIATLNIHTEVELYNWAIGNIIDIVYHDRPVGPIDKQHYHLPGYIVIDIQHLKKTSNIAPWDNLHKTVSTQYIHNAKLILHPNLTYNNSMCLFQWGPTIAENLAVQ